MYCTVADVINDMSEPAVAQASNDADPTVVDAVRVEQYIAKASELIEAHLRGRYPTPFVNADGVGLLNDCCVTIVRVKLLRRRNQSNEFDEKRLDDVMATLQKIQRGELTLGVGTGATTSDRPRFVRTACREQIFSTDVLSRY